MNLPCGQFSPVEAAADAAFDEAIAITGVGLVSAAGAGVEALWSALAARRSHLGPLRQIDTRDLLVTRGGEVPDAVLDAHWPCERSDRALRMASLALEEAIGSAALAGDARAATHTAPRDDVGLALGTALGSVQTLERLVAGDGGARSWRDVPQRRLAGALRDRFALGGPLWNFSVTCVSGLYAIEQAIAELRLGRAGVMVCGGLDTLSRFMQSGFCALRALSPSGTLRAFGREHDGIVLGEGAAFVVLELASHARARGATIRAVLSANELRSDATHMTSPDASGAGMAAAIRGALERAGLRPSEVACVTPTATGSPIYDRMQSAAVLDTFGDAGARVPVTTWEPCIGHALASTGVLGIVHAVAMLERGEALPVFDTGEIDADCRLRYVLDGAQRLEGDAVLALTVGFGGQNGAALVTRARDDDGSTSPRDASGHVDAAATRRRVSRVSRALVAARIVAAAAYGRRPRAEADGAPLVWRLGDGCGPRKPTSAPASDTTDALPSTDPEDLGAAFPSRWNARRELSPPLRPLVSALAAALADAGWWTPGQTEHVAGGLVVGSDLQSLDEAHRHARDLSRTGPSGISPTGFLFSLPSSAAAVAGILFGLREYQATLTGDEAGLLALRHAVDRVALGRCERLVVAALTTARAELAGLLGGAAGGLSADDELDLAVAVCLEASSENAPPIAPGVGTADARPLELPAALATLAAPGLLAALASWTGAESDCAG